MKTRARRRSASIASRLKGIAAIQVVICVILFLVMFINRPYDAYRRYEQDTTQAAALFSTIVSGYVDAMVESSKYPGQILSNAMERTFIAEALGSAHAIQSNLSFCSQLYRHGKALMDQYACLDKAAVFDLEGNAVYVSRSRATYYLTKSAADAPWLTQAVEARGGVIILPPDKFEETGLPMLFENELVIARAVFDPIKLKAMGVYVLSIPGDVFEASFDAYRVMPQQEYALIYSDQVLISRLPQVDADISQRPLRELSSQITRQDGVIYLLSYYRFSSGGCMVVRAPLSAILTEILKINFALLAVIFLVLCLFVAIICRLLNDILRPLKRLRGAFDATTDSFFPTLAPADVPPDLEPLFLAYNRMSSRIDLLVNEGLRKDVARREIEVQLLRTQINPHYLYNTLECIHMRAYVNHDFEVATMAELLGGNLQYGLRETNAKVPLHVEFEKAGEYMTLVSYHYGERVQMIGHLDKGIRDCLVIKLLLQPLIENAIQHGLTAERTLTIEVLGYPRDENTLCLQVCDDGEGMTPQACEALTRRLEDERGEDAIGLRNVHRRLRLYYGPEYGVSVASVPNQSTVVTLLLPRQYGKEEG